MNKKVKKIYTDLYTNQGTVYASATSREVRTPCRCTNIRKSISVFFYVYKKLSEEDRRYIVLRSNEDKYKYVR